MVSVNIRRCERSWYRRKIKRRLNHNRFYSLFVGQVISKWFSVCPCSEIRYLGLLNHRRPQSSRSVGRYHSMRHFRHNYWSVHCLPSYLRWCYSWKTALDPPLAHARINKIPSNHTLTHFTQHYKPGAQLIDDANARVKSSSSLTTFPYLLTYRAQFLRSVSKVKCYDFEVA